MSAAAAHKADKSFIYAPQVMLVVSQNLYFLRTKLVYIYANVGGWLRCDFIVQNADFATRLLIKHCGKASNVPALIFKYIKRLIIIIAQFYMCDLKSKILYARKSRC